MSDFDSNKNSKLASLLQTYGLLSQKNPNRFTSDQVQEVVLGPAADLAEKTQKLVKIQAQRAQPEKNRADSEATQKAFSILSSLGKDIRSILNPQNPSKASVNAEEQDESAKEEISSASRRNSF